MIRGIFYLAIEGTLLLGVLIPAPKLYAEQAKPAIPTAESAPVTGERLFEQAEQLHKAGEIDKALIYYTQAIKQNPRYVQAYLNRANLYYTQKQYKLAIADYRQVIALAPDNVDAYGSLGWLLLLEGRFEEARTMTQKAHELDPGAFAWAINLGHLYLLTGEGETARRYYLQGLDYIETDQQLEEGPVADFKLFMEKGWQVEVMQQELAWIKQAYFPRQRWNLLNQEAMALYQAGDYGKAEFTAQEARMIAENTFGNRAS